MDLTSVHCISLCPQNQNKDRAGTACVVGKVFTYLSPTLTFVSELLFRVALLSGSLLHCLCSCLALMPLKTNKAQSSSLAIESLK